MRYGIVLALGVLALAGQGCRKQSFEERVAEEVKQYNASNVRRPVDEFTVLDSMSFEASTLTIGYHHTMTGAAADSTKITAEVREKMHENLKAVVRGSVQWRDYKERGCNFAFLYHSEGSGNILLADTIRPADYN